MVTRDYFKQQLNYEKKYGERTVVLMQVGGFYEVYEYIPEDSIDKIYDINIGKTNEISKILNMLVSKKNKKLAHTLENPYMLGFPCSSIDKNKEVLINNNYIVVKIDQTDGESKTKKNRVVSEILSPATNIDNVGSLPITNQIVSLYISCEKKTKKLENMVLVSGMSTIDVSTGKNFVAEAASKNEDCLHSIHEIYRFLSSHQPKEIIIYLNQLDDTEEIKEYLEKKLELDKYQLVITKFDVNNEYLNINYQLKYLNEIFPGISLENLGLAEMKYARISYILLLKYCQEHNDKFISKICKPEIFGLNVNNILTLTHNAIDQLNILPGKSDKNKKPKFDSLYSVLNNASTSLGKRYLKNMLLSPLTNVEELNKYYDITDDLMDQELIEALEKYLRNIPDIERYQRKLQLQMIKPQELVILFQSYSTFSEMHEMLSKLHKKYIKDILLKKEEIDDLNKCIEKFYSLVDIDSLETSYIVGEKIEFESPFIKTGCDKSIDDSYQSLLNCKLELDKICKHLSKFTTGNPIILSQKSAKEEKNQILTTTVKANAIKKSKIDENLCGKLIFTTNKSKVIISSDKISGYSDHLELLKNSIGGHLYKVYHQLLRNISEQHTYFDALVKFISFLDYIKSNAKTALKYDYYRPVISNEYNSSFIHGEEMRHPIIERIIDGEYVSNNISLGACEPHGMLLYGVNATGKSSLTKMIGVNIIMAQIGGFVSGKMKYYPYTQIITRLSGNDDMLKGQSSFVVEMTELRTVLRNTNSRTLVLGDELTRGTESISGTSLTVATILTLLNIKSSFIFSTHMHHLVDMDEIKSTGCDLKICHLTTICDNDTKELLYDRKLTDGSGPSIYGLEVARSLELGEDFINLADSIRKKITNTLSPYNIKQNS